MNDQTPKDENPHLSAEQKAQMSEVSYYTRAAETGELLAVLLQGLGTPLHAISIIGAKMVSIALTIVAEKNREVAEQMRDELAQGFLEMLQRLDLAPKPNTEGPNGKAN